LCDYAARTICLAAVKIVEPDESRDNPALPIASKPA
jgi:hypothetical protein